jgi:hypothetical protein
MKHLSLLAAGSALLCNSPFVQANSIPSTLLIDQSGLVLMVDGKDPNASVTFGITGGIHRLGLKFGFMRRDTLRALDFGFMRGDTFRSLDSGWRQKKKPIFTGGTMVDFAVRNRGADKRFGTSDDRIFRLSDPAHYANQYYSGAISPWKSSDPEQAETYYRNLTMFWDLDHNGITDLRITLHTRNAHDGMYFVASATPVPLPAAAWLLGTGLAGLAALARRRENNNNSCPTSVRFISP